MDWSEGELGTGRLTRIIGWSKCKWSRDLPASAGKCVQKIQRNNINKRKEHTTRIAAQTLTQKSVKDISNWVFFFFAPSESQMEHRRRWRVRRKQKKKRKRIKKGTGFATRGYGFIRVGWETSKHSEKFVVSGFPCAIPSSMTNMLSYLDAVWIHLFEVQIYVLRSSKVLEYKCFWHIPVGFTFV